MKDIYQDKLLKYPLTDYEYSLIDEVWDFMNIFTQPYVFISDYRQHVITEIRHRYTPEEFLLYESILNKLFWNLRWILFPLWDKPEMNEMDYDKCIKNNYNSTKQIPYSLLLCKFESYTDEGDLDQKLTNNPIFKTTYYRSFINKLIIIDKANKQIISKPIEGSSDIFAKNYFNLMTMTVLLDKKLYEKYMSVPYNIKNSNIELSEYYYQNDYGFPNLNYCTYSFGTQEDRLDRIKKMYYEGKPKAKYWFKLLK